jgi:hypothetical protein
MNAKFRQWLEFLDGTRPGDADNGPAPNCCLSFKLENPQG